MTHKCTQFSGMPIIYHTPAKSINTFGINETGHYTQQARKTSHTRKGKPILYNGRKYDPKNPTITRRSKAGTRLPRQRHRTGTKTTQDRPSPRGRQIVPGIRYGQKNMAARVTHAPAADTPYGASIPHVPVTAQKTGAHPYRHHTARHTRTIRHLRNQRTRQGSSVYIIRTPERAHVIIQQAKIFGSHRHEKESGHRCAWQRTQNTHKKNAQKKLPNP